MVSCKGPGYSGSRIDGIQVPILFVHLHLQYFLIKIRKTKHKFSKQVITGDLTHLNAFVSISECVHCGLFVALELGEHRVRLVQSHLRITMSTFAGIWTPWSFSVI